MTRGKVAILPWGDVFEDYLDTIGATIEDFATKMSGGWLFGYLDALRGVGFDGCIICVSRRARTVERFVHPSTSVATLVIPARRLYRVLRGVPAIMSPVRWDRAGQFALSARALEQVLRAEGVTHVICQEYEYHRLTHCVRAGHSAGVAVLASFQGGTESCARVRRRRARAIRATDGFIIASGPEADRVVRSYDVPEEKVHRVPNPLDVQLWHPEDRQAARQTAAIPLEARIAVCHTRIDIPNKGLDVMIEAWRLLKARRPDDDLRLHLIGSGRDAEVLRAEISQRPVPGLRWTGYTSNRADMRAELSLADLYVMASRHEGFAVAPLEAMACGLPVILSDAPGAAEILPDGEVNGGWIVPSGDAARLSDALEARLTDIDLCRRVGTAARKRVESFASTFSVGPLLATALEAADLERGYRSLDLLRFD